MANEKPPEPFDLEQVYDEQISPLMGQVLEICKRHRMPMVASFQYALHEDGDAEHCSSSLGYKDRGPSDMIRRMALLLSGIKQPGMRITTRDERGNILSQDVILDPLPGD